MQLSYLDNPLLLEDQIDKLNDAELKQFNFGYAVALMGILEQYTETKQRLLAKCLDPDISRDLKRQLLSRVHIIDVFEKHLKRRVEFLEPVL